MQAVPPAPRSTTLALLDGERRVLARIAAGVPLAQVLEALARELEARAPGELQACVLLLDPSTQRLKVGAAPSMPDDFRAAIERQPNGQDGPFGPALSQLAPVVDGDIVDDPAWASLREPALRHGLSRCWLMPIRAADGQALGLFGFFLAEPQHMTASEFDAFVLTAQTAALAIERHASDRQLREAEAWHRQILDSATDYAIIALDTEGRVTRWNEGARRMLGWREDEMLGQTLHRCFTPKDIENGRIEREMAAARAGHPSPDEGWRVRRDGSRLWASGEMTQLRGDGGEAQGFVKVLRNRTRQRAADLRQAFLFELSERLHEPDGPQAAGATVVSRLGALLEVSRVGFARVDPRDRVHVEHDWTDGSLPSLAGDYDLADYGPGLLPALRQGQPVVVDDVSADPRTAASAAHYAALSIASLLWVPLAPVPQGGDGGALVFVCGSTPRRWYDDEVVLLREVGERLRAAAERTRARDALRVSEERLLIAQRAGGMGSFELFPLEGEVAVSSSFCALWGLPVQESLPVSAMVALVHPDDRRLLASEPNPAPQQLAYVEYRIHRADTGELRWLARRGEALPDPATGRPRYLGVCYDITERRLAIEALAASRQSLLLATEAAEIGTWDLAPDTGVLAWTDRTRAMFGLPPGAPIDMGTFERGLHPDDRAATLAAFAAATDPQRREVYDVEYRTIGLDDGVQRWVAAKGKGIFDDAGRCVRAVGTAIDITARKRAEQALRDETQALETLNRTAALLAENFDLDTMVQRVVDAGVQLTGARFGAFFYTARNADGERLSLYALSGADRAAFETFGMPRATDVFAPTFRGQGAVRSDDITQDPRYGHNPPHAGMPAGHLPVRSYLAVPVVARSGDVLGCLLFGHPEPAVFADRAERLATGLAAQAAIAIDNARLFRATQRDNETLEARVEERTRERDQVWALTEDLLAIADAHGQLQRVSASWTRQLGHPPARLLLQPLSAVLHPQDQPALADAVLRMRGGGQPVRVENRVGTAEGEWRVIAWTLSPEPGTGRFVATGRDVTAERQRQAQLQEAQEALRQSQKMEAVGQLTGGIAHDFNNLLQGITGSLDLIRRRVQQGRTGDLDRFVAGAMASAQRAASLTHRLLAFSRRQPLDPRPVAANPLVASMEDMLRRTLGEAIALELALSPTLWLTMCDANQLESAILNLCINARDAMPTGGRLTIETVNTTLDAGYAVRVRDIAPGQYVCISVTDSGTGMPPEVLARAFEPFFTTKPIGQGTGLGLSMIYGFARQSEGHARIYSEPGRGTTVKLYLPRHVGEGALPEEAPPAAEEHAASAGHVVLVVEDEAVVRGLVIDVLQELGYGVLEAADGPSGLALLQSGEPIDLLVSDIGLPGLNGRQLADAARLMRPELKVLFMTGYAETAAVANGFLAPGMHMITKPFSMEAMAARLREVLGPA